MDTIIYLAALAGADLDIMFRGVDLLTDNHTHIHITTASIILSVEVITLIIDELNVLWACLFTNILSM